MRDFIQNDNYQHDGTVETVLANGSSCSFVAQDGTALTTTNGTVVPKLVPFMLASALDLDGMMGNPMNRNIALKNSITINPYNFDYSVRKFTEPDRLEAINFNYVHGVGGADNTSVSIVVYAQAPYRPGSAENPYPAMLRLFASSPDYLGISSMKKQFANCIASSDKSLFNVVMSEEVNGSFNITVECLAPRKMSYEISDNLTSQITQDGLANNLTITQTKLSGYLSGTYIDARYASINDGANPRFDRMAKGNTYKNVITEDKPVRNGRVQLIITTKEANQYPVIAGDDNSPEKMLIIETSQPELDEMEVVLKAIKAKLSGAIYEPKMMRSSMGIPVADLSPELTDEHTGAEVPTETPEVTPPVVTAEEPIVKITDSGVQSA